MAGQTAFLNLVKPGFREFTDSWQVPMNQNADAIDTFASSINSEITTARFSKASLALFLGVAHNTDGTLLPTPEVIIARNSPISGDKDASSAALTLGPRINIIDREVWRAREGLGDMRDALARRYAMWSSVVIDGAKNSNGYPTWMGNTGAQVDINGSATNIILSINGYFCRIRTLTSVAISGSAGTYYIYAEYAAAGVQRVDGDSTVAPPSTPTGVTSNDTDSQPRIFSDVTKDFSVLDVKAGDVLTLIDGGDKGTYLIKDVGISGDNSKLRIVGLFPVGGIASINYTISDPLAVTLGFTGTQSSSANRMYVGECDFDSVAVTAIRPRHFKDTFVGEWRAVDVTTGGGVFEQIWNHNLGTDHLDIEVQASISNTGSAPVEMLSLNTMLDTTGVSVTSTLGISNTLVFNPGSGNATLTGGVALTGSVSAALTGSNVPVRSVKGKWTTNQVFVKNAITSKFFTDYDGVARTSGYIRVIVRRRG